MSFTVAVDRVVSDTYLRATGKASGLTFGSTKYVKILGLMNFYMREFANELPWKSLRSTFTLAGTVTATDTFPLLATIDMLSQQEGDFVRIYHTGGTVESDYTIVPIERLYNDGHTLNNGGVELANGNGTCAESAGSLVFSTPFLTTSPQFGGTIKVPGQSIPPTLVLATDPIVVDDPMWLSTRCAAEYVRTDITRSQLYPTLIQEANDLMDKMKSSNDSQHETTYTGGFQPLADSWS